MTKTLKVLSLFSGIGAFEKALTKQGIPFELVGFSEINKYAIKSYCAIHNVDESANFGSVTNIDGTNLGHISLLTHGSPCQSFSQIGAKEGGDEGSGTKSSLLWETVRIVSESKPKVVIWENVKGVLNKTNIHNFNKYIEKLDELGYESTYKVIEPVDCGIPQSRSRIFVVSILKEIGHKFEFPTEKIESPPAYSFLEDEVNSKYNLKTVKDFFIRNYAAQKAKGNGFKFTPKLRENFLVANAITTRSGSRMDDNFIIVEGTEDNLHDAVVRKLSSKEVFRLMGFEDSDWEATQRAGISDTQLFMQGGNSIVVNVAETIFKELYKK